MFSMGTGLSFALQKGSIERFVVVVYWLCGSGQP
jgi:hypothetical protein